MATHWTCETCSKTIPKLPRAYSIRIESPDTDDRRGRRQLLLFCTQECVRLYFHGWPHAGGVS